MGENDFVSDSTFQMALSAIKETSQQLAISVKESNDRMEATANRIEEYLKEETTNRVVMGKELHSRINNKTDKETLDATAGRLDKRISIVVGTFVSIGLFVLGGIGALYMFIVDHITKGITHILK